MNQFPRPHRRSRRPIHPAALLKADGALHLCLLGAQRVGAGFEEARRCATILREDFSDEDLRLVACGGELLRDQHPDIWMGEGSVEESVHWIAETLCRVQMVVEEVQ